MLSFASSKPKSGASPVVGSGNNRLERDADRFADGTTRSQQPASFGSAFGYDLSRVRVHNDTSAFGPSAIVRGAVGPPDPNATQQATPPPPASGTAGASPNASPQQQPALSTPSFSIAAPQRQAVSAWIPDPQQRGDLFGLTALPAFTAPEFHLDRAPNGHAFVVRPTHADLQAVVMRFLAPGQYYDPTFKGMQCDVSVDRSCYPDGKMIGVKLYWDVTSAGSALLAAGEQEHCDDYAFAFYAVLGRAAEIVNELAASGTTFPSEADARAELRKRSPLDPKDWKPYFECLVRASIAERDGSQHLWHTPLSMHSTALRRQARLVSRGNGQYDAFAPILMAEVGKHSTFDVVNASAAQCNARAQGAAPGGKAVGREQPAHDKDDDFSDDPLSADGFGPNDSTIRVKPGPVRTTLIGQMKDTEGATFPGHEPDDGAWIQEFLQFFNLSPVASLDSTDRYAFLRSAPPQRALTFTEVVDKVIEQGALDGHMLDRKKVVGGVAVRLPAPPPSPSGQTSFYLTFSLVRTGHVNLATGKTERPDSPGGQIAGQITWELHKENESGAELSWVGQLATFRDASGPGEQYAGPFRLQSAYTGFQAAWVFSFLKGSLQVQPLAQALTGFARGQQSDGVIRLVPAAQVGLGGQVVYVVPKTGEHLQVGGQAVAAFTAPAGVQSTLDLAPSVFLQWKF